MASHQSLEGLNSGKYQGTKSLKLSCGLTEFPKEILSLCQTLEILDLSGNSQLSTLPSDFNRLHKLRIAFFSDCAFSTFPSQLAKCRSLEMIAFKGNGMTTIPENSFPRKLRWLILTNNKITEIPTAIGQCHRLQKCMLAGNQISSLPDEMAQCRKLGLLRLSSNNLVSIPRWLFDLPELSFISLSGNPCVSPSASNSLMSIPWDALQAYQILGEGASGIITSGAWTPPFPPQAQKIDIAIKLFKGEVTDGSPMDEMNACIAAGSHPSLIDPIGKIEGHPEKKGLVLELIPPRYKNLGLPPTLDTCTRDSFLPQTVLSVTQCLSILRGIASASQHLHNRGIAHGDLYAHNILFDKMGHALLGDFGAATIYGRDFSYAESIEKMEVFAFGHLIEDLLGLVERKVGEDVMDEKDSFVMEALNVLHYQCSNPVVLERPDFQLVCDALDGL